MLPSLICPKCGGFISDNMGVGDLGSYAINKCNRVCIDCGLGFTNDVKNPVLVFKNPEDNVPERYREGLNLALGNMINEGNWLSKRNNLCSENSKDAIVWTVFNEFLRDKYLCYNFAQQVAGFPMYGKPEILLWGVNMVDAGHLTREALIGSSKSIGEKRNFLSEPDVVMDYGRYGLIFIECKYNRPNETKEETFKGWLKYDNADIFYDFNKIKQGGQYQFTRLWRVGDEMAGDRPFILVNIVRECDLLDSEIENKKRFSAHIYERKNRIFMTISWKKLIGQINRIFPVHHYARVKNLC